MTNIEFPLNEVQVSLLKLTEHLREDELQDLKQLIIAFKSRRLEMLIENVWEEKGWSEATMRTFLDAHMRTPYRSNKQARPA